MKDTFNRGLTFYYYGDGLLEKVTDPAGRNHTFEYTTTSPKKLVKVTVLGSASDGATRPSFVWEFSYDNRTTRDGLIWAYGGTHAGDGYTGDLVTQKKEPGGETTHYFYQAVNRTSMASPDWDGRVRAMEWSSFGDPTREDRHRIELQDNRLTYKIVSDLSYGTYQSVLYEYSAPQEHPDAHDVKRITNETTGESVEYYQRWEYDATGRLTRRERRLGATGVPKEFHEFSWDGADKLREVKSSGTGADGTFTTVWSATYAGDGIRATKTDGQGVHGYDYAGDTLLRETGPTPATYMPGIGQGNYFFHEDWLGSSRYVTDGFAATHSAAAWDAWGRKTEATQTPHPSNLQWGAEWGYQTDPNAGVGLVLMGQRYYDPEVGRFISPDPIGFAGGLNVYAYCDGDPINFADPLGLYRTGSYWGDVGEVFKGYGDTLNPVNWYNGAKGLYEVGRNCGAGAALQAFGSGLWSGLTDWTTTDDPRAFGRSFGTVLTTAAPGIPKGVAGARGAVSSARSFFGIRPYPVLTRSLITGTTRPAHRTSANTALYSRLAWNPFLRWKLNRALGADVMAHMRSGKSGYLNPPGTEWHHPVDMPGHMELLRRTVHRDPQFQPAFHPGPNGGGGFAANF